MPVTGYNPHRVTLYDVCRQTGLSTATVSRVINHSPRVHPLTRQRVQRVIQKLGYFPSHTARNLARQREDTLGVIFPTLASGFFTEILCGIDEVAAEHELHLLTAFSHGRRDEQELVRRVLSEGRVEALILMNLLLPDRFIRQICDGHTPIVLIDKPVTGADCFAVTMDNLTGAQAMVRHLLSHDYRDLALINGPADNYDAQQRLAGCRRALRAAGEDISDDRIWSGAFTEQSGREAMLRRLDDRQPLPRAIFALNDAMAIGALEVLRQRGLRVPQDVALVGFDDIESARHLELTTVRIPMRQIGHQAARAAIERIEGRQSQNHIVLPAELVVRRSCGCAQGANHA